MQIFKQLNNILEPKKRIKQKEKNLLTKQEQVITQKLDECDEIIDQKDNEYGKSLLNFLVLDKDIVQKAVKMHIYRGNYNNFINLDQKKNQNQMDNGFKAKTFKDFGLKKAIDFNDSDGNKSEEENRQQFYKKVEQRLKIKPKLSHKNNPL